MTFFDHIHLLHFFTHSLEFIYVLRVTGAAACGAAALEDADVALSLLQSLIVLIKATVMVIFEVTECLFKFLNLGPE